MSLNKTVRQTNNMKSYLPSFAGKVLSVICEHADSSQILADSRFEIQGDRLFLVGTVPKQSSRNNWMEGLPSAIAWETVQDYVIFDSIDDYLDRLKTTHGRKKKKKA
jgi:hypothetical protein